MAEIKNPTEVELKDVPIEVGTSNVPVESLYSNSTSFVATPFDLRLLFGQIRPVNSTGTLINEQRMSIVMSWEHAKALLDALKKSVEDHENDFGPLHYKKLTEK